MKKGKAFVAALLGSVVEWYDYSLYAFMAAILSDRFFPNSDPTTSFTNYLLIFAIGFLGGPIGAYIFGCIGDGFGRKYALRFNIIGIALPTVCMGLLPSYEEAGSIAVIGLCICRLIQGMFIYAEQDGATIFIYETMPKKHASLCSSMYWVFASIGIVIAGYFSQLALTPELALPGTLAVHTWRLPFLFSGVLAIFVIWFRKYLAESYDYTLYSANNAAPPSRSFSGFLAVLKENKSAIFVGVLVKGSIEGVAFFYLDFWNNYLQKIIGLFTPAQACFNAMLITLISTILAPACGYITDRIGVINTLKLGAVLCLIMMSINGMFLHYYHTAPLWLMSITAIIVILYCIPIYVFVAKMFFIGERYRCVSICSATGSMIFASTTPLFANLTWDYFRHPVAPLFYCGALIIMGFVATFFAKLKGDSNNPTYLFKSKTDANPNLGCRSA